MRPRKVVKFPLVWGKLAGLFLGYLLAGPLGGVIGVIVGHFFDQGVQLNLDPIHQAEAIQRAFFNTTFTIMGHIAKADGRVDQHEINAANRVMQKLELTRQQRQEAIELFNAGKDPNFNFQGYIDLLLRHCRHRRDILQFFIEMQIEAAMVDGQVSSDKIPMLGQLCRALEFSMQDFDALRARAYAEDQFYSNTQQESRTSDPITEAYAILGVQPHDDMKTIKQSYRRLIKQYHPDKLVSLGLPEEMMKLAQEKTKKLTSAYDLIRSARGER